MAVASQPLAKGAPLTVDGQTFTTREFIGQGHKVALRRISGGDFVVKYGEKLGRAQRDIEQGEWVHTHNLGYDGRLGEAECGADRRPTEYFDDSQIPTFRGYARSDGSTGTRNYVAVIASVNCSSYVTKQIADAFDKLPPSENFDGVVALPHDDGCGLEGNEDLRLLRRTLGGMILHPNVAAVLTVGLGCEVNNLQEMLASVHDLAPAGKPRQVAKLEIQRSGGTAKTVEAGIRKVHELIEYAKQCRRSERKASELVLGLNCGGSDAFSGISANPALGRASDLLVRCRGTVILPETTEMFGAEHLLVRRARSREVGDKILGMIRWYEDYLAKFGVTADSNPAPGNKQGGISNIVEKSLGAIAKGGSTEITDVLEYGERVRTNGLMLMNTPGYDPVSVTGVVAGGSNIFCFTTGRGTGIGSPLVPVIKIATNNHVFSVMNDNMDINAGTIVDGSETHEQVGRRIFEEILSVASGNRSKAEVLGHRELVIWKIGPYL